MQYENDADQLTTNISFLFLQAPSAMKIPLTRLLYTVKMIYNISIAMCGVVNKILRFRFHTRIDSEPGDGFGCQYTGKRSSKFGVKHPSWDGGGYSSSQC